MSMKLLNLFKKTKLNKKSGKFAEFFLYAPKNKKEEIFKTVARKANEEQRKLFVKSAH